MKTLSPIRVAASASLYALFLFQLSATPARVFAGVAIPDGAAQEPAGFGSIDPAPPTGITPEEIAACKASHTGKFLAELLRT